MTDLTRLQSIFKEFRETTVLVEKGVAPKCAMPVNPPNFVPAKTVKEINKKAKSLGLGRIVNKNITDPKAFLRRANEILEEAARVQRKYPMVLKHAKTDKWSLKSIELWKESGLDMEGWAGSVGDYTPSDKLIRLASNRSAYEGPILGEMHVDTTATGVFRHEYGHYLQDRIDKTKAYKEFTELHQKHSSAWWKKNVSNYGGQDLDEAFAESFCAYTNPLYRKIRQPRLHPQIENIMEEITGGL